MSTENTTTSMGGGSSTKEKVLKTEVETTVHEVIIEGPDSLLKPKETRIRKNKKLMMRLGIGTILALLVLAIASSIVVQKTPLSPKKAKVLSETELIRVSQKIDAFLTQNKGKPGMDDNMGFALAEVSNKIKNRRMAEITPLDRITASLVQANIDMKALEIEATSTAYLALHNQMDIVQAHSKYVELVKKIKKTKYLHRVSLQQIAVDLASINDPNAATLKLLAKDGKINHSIMMHRLGEMYQQVFRKSPPFKAHTPEITPEKLNDIRSRISNLQLPALTKDLYRHFLRSS